MRQAFALNFTGGAQIHVGVAAGETVLKAIGGGVPGKDQSSHRVS
jgi:hypothetical protein